MIENNYKDDEIAIVGHQTNFRYLTAKNFTSTYLPLDYDDLDNSILTEWMIN